MATTLEKISEAVINGDAVAVRELVEKALAEGFNPQTIFERSLTSAMNEVGRRMEVEEYYIPEVLLCDRAVKAATKILKPIMVKTEMVEPLGRVVVGTVEGDLHDIGKNIVAMMLEGVGFEVIDLGISVTARKFIETVRETHADILCMSALLTITMERMREVIQDLLTTSCRKNVLIMVGGAPVIEKFANEIGADGYAEDAGGAARLAQKLSSNRPSSRSRIKS